MFMFTEDGTPQKTAEELQKEFEAKEASFKAEMEELKKKADASSQNFERAKKAEEKVKELEGKKPESTSEGEPKGFDSAAFEKRMEEKYALREQGFSPDQIAEVEAYAKGKGISISEAAQSPFIKKAVDGLNAEKKSEESIPASSNKGPTINGKSADEILKSGTAAEKQAAWEALMKKGGAKRNE